MKKPQRQCCECEKILSKDETALCQKLLGRDTEDFYCLECLVHLISVR